MAEKKVKPGKRRWLLLRGLAREVRHWGEFPALLQKAFPRDEVVCLDLPGAGVHFDEPCPVPISKMRASLRGEWRALGKSGGNDIVLGLSLGGMIALDWASSHPKDFATVITVNTSLAKLSPPWHRLTPWALAQMLKIAKTRDPLVKEKKIAAMTNARKPSAKELKERASFYGDQPMSISNTLRQFISAVTVPMPKLNEKSHLIVVRSLGDKLCRPECSERLARHFHATLQTHPTGGHDLPVDEPRWLVERLKENV